jgi:hypothetical protein
MPTPATQVQSVGYKAELYSYDLDGRIIAVREAQSGYDYITGQITAPNLASATLRATTSYDAMGRVVGYAEYTAGGVAQHERYGIVHDLRGAVIVEKITVICLTLPIFPD